MRFYHLLFSVLALVTISACAPDDPEKKVYPELTTLDETMWYSYDQRDVIFYDIYYDGNDKGRMLGYDTAERVNEIVNRPFSYKFTPATDLLDAIVDIWFEDGARYGGILIPKGNLQISNKDVYLIQLYELTEDGKEILYDDKGNIKSTILMWKE